MPTLLEKKMEAFRQRFVKTGEKGDIPIRPSIVLPWLSQAFQEVLTERDKEIIEMLGRMEVKVSDCVHRPNDSCDSDCATQQYDSIYNQALKEAIKYIKHHKSTTV